MREAFKFLNEFQDEVSKDKHDSGSELPPRIGDYQIVRKIGQGGMGIVYEAVQESLDRKVAIKTLNDHPLNAPRKATRFRREARAIAKLHHNNIVNLFGSGVHNGIPYFAMHLINGQSLDQLLGQAKSNPELPNLLLGPKRFENIAQIGIQIAKALQYAHDQGILHRDIKPSNLIVDESETTWVSDFGLAKLTSEPDATNSIDVVGTLRYLPPEAVNGEWGPASDVYSLGLTLYELLALTPAYPESDRIVLLNRKSSGERPKRIAVAGLKVPPDLENIIGKATEHKPSARYDDAEQFAEDLKRFIAGESTLARPVGPITRLAKWSKRRKALAGLLFTILAVAIFGIPLLTLMWLRSENALHQLKAEQTKTVVARQQERNALVAAKDASRASEAASYSSSMQLAQQYLLDGNIPEAERILLQWLPGAKGRVEDATTDEIVDHRGWEWYYMHEQLDDSLMTLRGDQEYVWSVAFSPDDSRIVTVHGPGPKRLKNHPSLPTGQCKVILWDAETGHQIGQFNDPDSNVFSAAISPDNKELATIGVDFDETNGVRANLIVWDLKSGKQLRRRKLPGTYDQFLLVEQDFRPNLPNVQYSNDGLELIVAPDPIEILDAKSFDSLAKIENGAAVAKLPNNDLIFSERIRPLGLYRFDRKSGQKKLLLPIMGLIQDIAISRETNLVSFRVHKKFLVGDTSTGKFKTKIEHYHAHLASISPDGLTAFYSKQSGVLYKKSFESPDLDVRCLGHQNTITSIAFSNDSKHMVTGSLDGTAKVWGTEIGCGANVVESYSTRLQHSLIADVEFIDDANIGYVSRGRLPEHSIIPGSGSVGAAGSNRVTLHTTFYANWPRTDFDFSPNGKRLAAPVLEPKLPKSPINFSMSDCVGIWSTESWRRLQAIHVAMTEIRSVSWSDNNRYLAVAGTDDEIHVIRIYERAKDAQGQWLDQLEEYPLVEFNAKPSYCLAFQGNRIASGFEGGVEVWNFDPNEVNTSPKIIGPATTFKTNGTVRYLDFSPDCKRLAAALKNQNTVAVMDLESSSLLYEKPGPRDICCVKFSPNGRRLALSGYEGIVFLCDSESGNQLLALKSCDESPGEKPINSRVVFSSDGRKIATNNHLGQISVWMLPPENSWNQLQSAESAAKVAIGK